MSENNFCPSCGVDYVDGLIPTCALLQKAELKIEKLERELAELRDEMMEFNLRKIEKMRKL